jgi:hypothetical protein
MSKYVQARFESYMPSKALNAIDHDYRQKAPDYLRDEHFHNSLENHVFGMQNSTNVKRAMHEDRETANEAFYQKNQRNLRANRDSSYLAAVVTLSNTVIEELERGEITEAELNETFERTAERMRREISEICGEDVRMYYGVVHYDEKTPHLHIAFNNRTEDGSSVYHLLKQNGYFSRVQDMVGEEFQHLGYERGVKKSETRAKHLNIRKMHEAEINTLREQIKQLQAEKKDIQEQNRALIADRDANRGEIDANNKAKRSLQDEINKLKEKRRKLEKLEDMAKQLDTSRQKRERPKINAEKYEEGVFSKKPMRKMTEHDYGALIEYTKKLENRVEEFERYEAILSYNKENRFKKAFEDFTNHRKYYKEIEEMAQIAKKQLERAKTQLQETERILDQYDGNTIIEEAREIEKRDKALKQKETALSNIQGQQEKLAKEIDQEQVHLAEKSRELTEREDALIENKMKFRAQHSELLSEAAALRKHYAYAVVTEKISELKEKKRTKENLNRADFKDTPDAIYDAFTKIAHAEKIEDVPEFEMKAIDNFAKSMENGFERAHKRGRGGRGGMMR